MNITKVLIDEYGMKKYQIHKIVGAPWNTVHFWYKGIFNPSKKYENKLRKIYDSKSKEAI